jgi:hypothetical protein
MPSATLMPDYCYCRVPGGAYFFTVNRLERRSDLLIRFRVAVRETRRQRPFPIDARAVMPELLIYRVRLTAPVYCVWRGGLGVLVSISIGQSLIFLATSQILVLPPWLVSASAKS